MLLDNLACEITLVPDFNHALANNSNNVCHGSTGRRGNFGSRARRDGKRSARPIRLGGTTAQPCAASLDGDGSEANRDGTPDLAHLSERDRLTRDNDRIGAVGHNRIALKRCAAGAAETIL
jgi:hypothetical protein